MPPVLYRYFTGTIQVLYRYFTGISGNVSSFNWKLEDNRLDTATPKTLSNHLANLDYSICVRREAGYCGIEWSTGTPETTQIGHFSLSGIVTATSQYGS